MNLIQIYHKNFRFIKLFTSRRMHALTFWIFQQWQDHTYWATHA